MGKQSGRLYYNGEDHYDLVFKGEGTDGAIYNHSKMYLGNKLIWKREMPKFLLLDSHGLATTETFGGISEFPNSAFKTVSAIGFLSGCYFLASGKKIYISDSGYDWKLIYEDEWNVRYMERIDDLEALIIITQRNIIYCNPNEQWGFTFENKFELNGTYSDHRIPAVNSGKRIFIKGIGFHNGNFLPGIVIDSERIYETDDISDCYAGQESKCFYKYASIHGYHIEKSYDAITWDYLCDVPKFNENGVEHQSMGYMFEYRGFLCIFNPSRKNLSASVVKIKGSQSYGRHIIIPYNDTVFLEKISTINDICVFGCWYYENKKIKYTAGITNNIFSAYYDGRDFINTKPVKKTIGNDYLMGNYCIDYCVSKEGALRFNRIIYR